MYNTPASPALSCSSCEQMETWAPSHIYCDKQHVTQHTGLQWKSVAHSATPHTIHANDTDAMVTSMPFDLKLLLNPQSILGAHGLSYQLSLTGTCVMACLSIMGAVIKELGRGKKKFFKSYTRK